MTRVVSEMQQVLSHAMGIQEQTKRTTEVSHEIQNKVDVITHHANNTSQSASETREISIDLEHLSQTIGVLAESIYFDC